MHAARPGGMDVRTSVSTLASPRDYAVTGFEVGDCVWSPCARAGFRRSTIVRVDAHCDSFFVEARDEQDLAFSGQLSVRRSDVRPFYELEPGRTFQDNTEMVHLDDANILDNLRKRYSQGEIYTYTANVLLAVNPYRSMPHLYTPEKRAFYSGKKQGVLAPHPYAIADMAYRQLLRDRKNQALIISGESGAGKTETAKITMHYLTQVSRTDAAHGVRIQDTIINANPILESFGNASTVMNRNSSRFGKYNEMMFNKVGSLVGAGIKTFLLESSRVVSQQPGEKNYHVFYQLLAGLDEETLDRLMLTRSDSYQLIYTDGAQPAQENSTDFKQLAAQFEELKTALSTFANEQVVFEIWEIIAALLHLGQVEFQETATAANGDCTPAADASPCSASPCSAFSVTTSSFAPQTQDAAVKVKDEAQDSLAEAADLLGLPLARLERVLQFKERKVLHQGGRVSHINCPRSKEQAKQTLQCIIKILYKRLFDKIVESINAVSNTKVQDKSRPESSYNSIGTLDIYGFERLQTNSFEQLCINLANERLQQFFVHEVLDAEMKMYAEEGLNIPGIELPDSEPVVSDIQAVMSRLDEHSLRSVKNLVRGNDDKDVKFCEQVHRDLIKDRKVPGALSALKLKGTRSGNGLGINDGFQIKHYAGPVSYSTKGWIDKNNDSLVPEIEAILADGDKNLVRGMADSKGINALSGERLNSVSENYLKNLNILLGTLSSCSVHYIRCFNPNQDRQAGAFDAKYVLDQVIQCGTVELVTIMHHGYPHRCLLTDLRERFRSLLPAEFDRYSNRDFLHAVLLAYEINETQWTIGTKRLFLKAGQLRVLESLRDVGSSASQDVIRKICRQFARKKVRRLAHAIEFFTYLQKVVRRSRTQRTVQALCKAVVVYLPLSRWLKKVRARLYGIKEIQAQQLKLVQLHTRRPVDLQVSTVKKLFVTFNSAASRKQIGKECTFVGQKWQAKQSESVLYFTGTLVLCAKLNAQTYLRKDTPESMKDPLTVGRPIDDVREVDLCETGLALPLSSTSSAPNCPVVAMCQHRCCNQVFATADANNNVMIWNWSGTRSWDMEAPALQLECCFQITRKRPIIDVCFLSKVPKRLAETHGRVLLMLTKVQNRPWLEITIFSVVGGHEFVESVTPVFVNCDDETSEEFERRNVHVSHFNMSRSESTLILTGTGFLKLFEICENGKGLLSLREVQVEQRFCFNGDVVSVCALPSPEGEDWITFGTSNGEMYGYYMHRKHGMITVGAGTGRYRQQGKLLHQDNIVQALVPGHVQKALTTSSSLVNESPVDERSLISVGGNGNIVTWRLNRDGWAPTEVLKTGMELACAHSSRLIPGVFLAVDEHNRRIMSFNREDPNGLANVSFCSLV